MNSQFIINQSYLCYDNHPKILERIYDWNGKLIQFKLCKKHSQDLDFSNYVSEILITSLDISENSKRTSK